MGNKSNISFMPLPKLRSITKVQDDELSRHYLGLNVGPDIVMKELGTEDFIKLYKNSSTQRDIIVKTAIEISLTDWSIVWLNLSKELRLYNSDGTLDKLRLATMSCQSQEDLKLLKNFYVENIIKRYNYKDPEYRQIISMVAN